MAFFRNIPTLLLLCLASTEMGFALLHSRLYRDLFRSYNKVVIPKISQDSIVSVTFGMTLNDVLDVNERTKETAFQAWLSLRWNDPALSWDPARYDNITTMRVPIERIWVPDVTGYNTIGRIETESPDIAVVSNDGTMFYIPKVTIRTICSGSAENTTCVIKFGSWVYSGMDLDLQVIDGQAIDLSSYSEWSRYGLLQAFCRRNVLYYTCCPEPYIDVLCTISFGEKSKMRGRGFFTGIKSYLWN